MIKKVLVLILGLLLGIFLGYIIFFGLLSPKPKVIGFLPYWLLSKAKTEYSPYITTLTYFGLTIDTNGKILKFEKPGEEEPGWHALKSGKVDPFLASSLKNNDSLSLLVFIADEASISALLENPNKHAKNLIEDVTPIMKKYNFSDLNLDIESVKPASDDARLRFEQFIGEVKKEMDKNSLGTLTIDISPDSLIHKRLINISSTEKLVDYIVLMGYDYHYMGSQVTGPVAPLSGAGTISEYDTETALKLALNKIDSKKIILGLPLYGYEWETIRSNTRAATIPSSGLTASTNRVEKLSEECQNCNTSEEVEAMEKYIIYKDSKTGTYHQIFFPDEKSTSAKIDLVNREKLGGVALWALGYEDSKILSGLKNRLFPFPF